MMRFGKRGDGQVVREKLSSSVGSIEKRNTFVGGGQKNGTPLRGRGGGTGVASKATPQKRPL